ncbi:MAG: response regulator transcription factor [Lachnospiraceae bacterium]|nr:response regulator transcription factor [Lachnospiraceae bacterium]
MKKRVLIVDDDIMTLKILRKYLEDTYDVVTENAGYRFVEKMANYEADLILLDIEMPVVNGVQAFDELIKNPELKDTPVVFLSGVSNPNLVRELMAKGAAGYLVKTIPKGELLSRLEKIFNESGSRKVTPEVLILDNDIDRLKEMREVLIANDYKVKVLRATVEAIEYIRNHHPNLFIIGRDSSGVEPNDVYKSIEGVIRSEHVITMVMEESFFDSELIDRVKAALSQQQ